MVDTVAVVGGGMIGSTAALALARTLDRQVIHVAPQHAGDERTTALLNDAVELLRELGVWDEVEPEAAPLKVMRLMDGSRRLLRPRPLDFASSEVGLPQFGYNIGNDVLLRALAREAVVERRATSVTSLDRVDDEWVLRLADGGAVMAGAVIAADGRNSMVRNAAGIGAKRWSYDQVALVTTFSHERPHASISAEFHTETGPFTQVPLPPTESKAHRSSLVWVVRPNEVPALLGLDTETLSQRIADGLGWMFGAVEVERDLTSYPLSGLIAETFGRDGVFLLGEAGHVFPPIGAQGANLGFRDIRDCVRTLLNVEHAVHASETYARARSADVGTRTMAIDALNRSILTGFLPVQLARTLGTGLLARSDALRRQLMTLGLASARPG